MVASKPVRKKPRRMHRMWEKRKLRMSPNQSIIILCFAISLHCFGRIQIERWPCTYARIACMYSMVMRKAMKFISWTVKPTSRRPYACLIHLMTRQTTYYLGTFSSRSPFSSACTWTSNASWTNQMDWGKMCNRYTKCQVSVCFEYRQSRRWTTASRTSTAVRMWWKSSIGMRSKSRRKLISTCGPTCLWNLSNLKNSKGTTKRWSVSNATSHLKIRGRCGRSDITCTCLGSIRQDRVQLLQAPAEASHSINLQRKIFFRRRER